MLNCIKFDFKKEIKVFTFGENSQLERLILKLLGCYGTFRQVHCLLYMYGGMMGVVFVILLSGSITIFNFQVCTLSFLMQSIKLKSLLNVVFIYFLYLCFTFLF